MVLASKGWFHQLWLGARRRYCAQEAYTMQGRTRLVGCPYEDCSRDPTATPKIGTRIMNLGAYMQVEQIFPGSRWCSASWFAMGLGRGADRTGLTGVFCFFVISFFALQEL